MSGIKVTNERPARPIPDTSSVEGDVTGENVDWDPPTGGTVENDQWKQPVRVATTATITIATALNAGDTIDGVTLVAGDRVLVKDQSAPAQNGIYVAGTTPERAVDLDDDDEVLGAVVYVVAGTANAGTTWAVTNTAATDIDTDPIDWAAFGGSGTAIEVDDEGTPLTVTLASIDFVGAGVTATAVGDDVTVTIPGAASSLPWFIVTDYGAVGDGTTDDTSAINSAIADLNTATKGVLYFPAGTYKVTSALTTVTASGTALGDGMASYDNAVAATRINFTSQTAVLFTVSAKAFRFEGIGFVNTYAGTPSAGTAILSDSAYLEQRVDYEACSFQGFYDNVDVKVGAQWSMRGCFNIAPVRYGIRIRNTVNPDAGDWAISDSNFSAQSYNSTAAIRVESAGGGKIVNCKINTALDSKFYVTGIDVAIGTGSDTSVLTIVGNSIENVTGDAIRMVTTGTGRFGLVAITGLQVGLYSNNTGYAVNLSAVTNGAIGTAGCLSNVVLDGLVLRTNGTARAAIALTNTDRVVLGDISLAGFNARYTSSGDTNTTDGSAPSFATPAIVLGSSAAAGAASTVIRSDSTIAAFDATVPVTQAFSDAAATGSAAFAARRDHVHGMPAASGIGPILIADTHSTPLVFADLLQVEAQDDLLYADP